MTAKYKTPRNGIEELIKRDKSKVRKDKPLPPTLKQVFTEKRNVNIMLRDRTVVSIQWLMDGYMRITTNSQRLEQILAAEKYQAWSSSSTFWPGEFYLASASTRLLMYIMSKGIRWIRE